MNAYSVSMNIGLAGQPNTGKSTLFNRLTGARQHVGNWPGKTVERKSGVYFLTALVIAGGVYRLGVMLF